MNSQEIPLSLKQNREQSESSPEIAIKKPEDLTYIIKNAFGGSQGARMLAADLLSRWICASSSGEDIRAQLQADLNIVLDRNREAAVDSTLRESIKTDKENFAFSVFSPRICGSRFVVNTVNNVLEEITEDDVIQNFRNAARFVLEKLLPCIKPEETDVDRY